MSVESPEALERSVLESKDREQLLAIASALGVKANSRTKKGDIVDRILEQVRRRRAAEPAARARTAMAATANGRPWPTRPRRPRPVARCRRGVGELVEARDAEPPAAAARAASTRPVAEREPAARAGASDRRRRRAARRVGAGRSADRRPRAGDRHRRATAGRRQATAIDAGAPRPAMPTGVARTDRTTARATASRASERTAKAPAAAAAGATATATGATAPRAPTASRRAGPRPPGRRRRAGRARRGGRLPRPPRRGLRLPAGERLPAEPRRRVRLGEAEPPVRPAQGRPRHRRQPARRAATRRTRPCCASTR